MAARELAHELDELTDDEQHILDRSLDDIVRDTPRTKVAAFRFKKLAAKAGADTVDAFKEILIGVLSETAKKVIFPHG